MKRLVPHLIYITNIILIVSSECELDSTSVICDNLSEKVEHLKPLAIEGVDSLHITDSDLPSLQSNFLDGFRDLKHVFLPGNNIREIEYGVFSSSGKSTKLPYLTTLDLSENNIEILEDEIFNSSGAVTLNLSSNGLKEIKIYAFRNMRNLQNLDLSLNQISDPKEENTFPLGIFRDNSGMHMLNISHNGLKKINVGTFSTLPFLFTLDLSHNELTHLPIGVFLGSAIRELYLNDNKLRMFEFPNVMNVHLTFNLINNNFECGYLANTISKINNAFYVRGKSVFTTNIYGIGCFTEQEEETKNGGNETSNEEVVDEGNNNNDGDDGGDDVMEEIKFLKYLSMATLGVGLLTVCCLSFCRKTREENDEPLLKEVTPLE